MELCFLKSHVVAPGKGSNHWAFRPEFLPNYDRKAIKQIKMEQLKLIESLSGEGCK